MATATHTPERLSSYNPATNELIGTVPIFGAAEVDATVARARIAAESWSQLSFRARSEELAAFRAAMAADAYARAREAAIDRLVRDRFGLPTIQY